MKRLRWQLLIVLLALLAIAALLLSQQQPQAEEVAIVPAPASGGAYTEALIGAPGRFNPLLDYFNAADRDVNRLLFSSLVRFDGRGLPQADLAESWGISRDGTTYNFAMRPGALWHDGQPVTSDDVVFTIELLRDPDLPIPADLRALWQAVEVRRLDDLNLQFRLAEPFAPFLDYLTFGILPAHLLGGMSAAQLVDDEFNLNPVGSGPYYLEQLETVDGQVTGLRLRAFDGYYQPRAFIDQVNFTYFPDAASALAAYQRDEVQGISQISDEILAQALVEPELNLYSGRVPLLTMVIFNLTDQQKPFFQDAEVRRALLEGLNRQWMADRVLGGQAVPASGPILPGTWAYFDGLPSFEYQSAAAIERLRAAGYTVPAASGGTRAKDGVALEFELLHPDDAEHTALAAAIQRDWAALGVEVSLTALPYATLVDDYLEEHAFEAVLIDLNLANSPDPDPYPFWHQAQANGGQNYSGWDDRQASEYLEQARVTVDPGERARLYRNFQVRFMNELPALPLFYPVYTYGVDQAVQGISLGPLFDPADRFFNVEAWFLRVERVAAPTLTPEP